MSHAKSLRVIGATLEAAQVTSFKLEKHAAPYRLWIAKRLFCFGPADISRLDARAQKNHFTRGSTSLSQQLRAAALHRIYLNDGGIALLRYSLVRF